jgi:hypothetical protein
LRFSSKFLFVEIERSKFLFVEIERFVQVKLAGLHDGLDGLQMIKSHKKS